MFSIQFVIYINFFRKKYDYFFKRQREQKYKNAYSEKLSVVKY